VGDIYLDTFFGGTGVAQGNAVITIVDDDIVGNDGSVIGLPYSRNGIHHNNKFPPSFPNHLTHFIIFLLHLIIGTSQKNNQFYYNYLIVAAIYPFSYLKQPPPNHLTEKI